MLNKKIYLPLFCSSLLPALAVAETTRPDATKPNIIIVLADDMGWGDSSTYGHKFIKSPNLDKLAAEGVKFTQGYSACGVCSPSRAAILTGRTPYRNGVWRHLSGIHKAHLRTSEITYPELLREVGYETCHVGKWHLLSRQQFGNPEFPQPGEQGGFDYWMTTHNNAEPSHKNPKNFVRNGEPVGELQGYSAPLVADEAIKWIKEDRDASKPFVMSVWFHEPHKPIATDIKFSELYPDQDEKKSRYYGNISQLDFALGQVMKTLDDEGIADNTLLVFTSDNGPLSSEGGETGGLRGIKRSDFEGGIRVPFIVRWPGHIKAGTVSDTPVIGTDIFSTVLDILNIEQPSDRTIDGVSMLPVFKGEVPAREIPMFWRTHVSGVDNRLAMRDGDWKIVSNDAMNKFLLFNIQKDRSEANDLSKEMPEKLDQMKRLLIKTWEGISEEGPNEWWESQKEKAKPGGKLSY